MARGKARTCAHVARGCCDDCHRAADRAYQAAYAQRRRDAELAMRMQGALRCQLRRGYGHVCGGRLEDVIDHATGIVSVVCVRCARAAQGQCVDCAVPLRSPTRRWKRCATCRAKADRQSQLRYRDEHARAVRKRARDRARAMPPDERARKNAIKAARRKVDPARVAARKRNASAEERARDRAWQAEYRARNCEALRQAARDAYYRKHPERPDPHCRKCASPIPWDGVGRPCLDCDACVTPAVRAAREAGRARRAPAVKVAVAPVLVPRPFVMARVDGYRLCLGDGCDRVATGRKKKCSHCKAREAEAARALLATLRRSA